MLSYRDIVEFDNSSNQSIPPRDAISENEYITEKKRQWGLATSSLPSPGNLMIPENSSESVGADVLQAPRFHNALAIRRDNFDVLITEPEPLSPSSWELKRVIAGAHQGWVRSLAMDSVTNQWFASGSADASIKIWDLASSQLKATLTGHIMAVRALSVLRKFPYLFSGSEDKTVRCWDLERTNSHLGCQIREYHGHVGGIYAMDIHPELDILFTCGRDSVVRVWDIRTRAQAIVLTGHRNDITSLASQIGDPQIISSGMDGTVRLWDLRKLTTQLCLTHHTKSVRLLSIHPHELTFCTGDSMGRINQWILPGGELLNQLGHPESGKIINTLLINPAYGCLFAGHDDGRMDFFDYVHGNRIQQHVSLPVPGTPELAIYASTFDMLGLRLITGEGDNTIKVWGQRDM